MDPIATIRMRSGGAIKIQLLPEAAPNTVSSFIYAASRGVMDGHAIQRIVPGSWIDISYNAFGHSEMKFLLPFESDLHPEIEPLESHLGCVCMGGYRPHGLASCEFFLPLRDCPEHRGVFPVFGRVVEGMDEVLRIASVPIRPVDFPYSKIEVNEPIEPEIIERVELELFGKTYPEPVRAAEQHMPPCWVHL